MASERAKEVLFLAIWICGKYVVTLGCNTYHKVMSFMPQSLGERFWPKVDKTPGQGPQGECWQWLASVDKDGYGMIGVTTPKRGNGKAHRVSFEMAKGSIPAGLIVRHSCHNRRCVNPAHLSLGTQADNIADMMQSGRHATAGATHCQRGHEFTEENTYITGNRRTCRACTLAGGRKNYRKAHAPVPPTSTGATCKTCGQKEPAVKFAPGRKECRKCQYVTTKAKRGVWNKQKQQSLNQSA